MKTARKKHTYYAITNKRVLIMITHAKGRKKSMSASNIESIFTETCSFDRNGTGTIIFGSMPFMMSANINSGMDIFQGAIQNSITAFFDIDDCEKVFQIYKNIKRT